MVSMNDCKKFFETEQSQFLQNLYLQWDSFITKHEIPNCDLLPAFVYSSWEESHSFHNDPNAVPLQWLPDFSEYYYKESVREYVGILEELKNLAALDGYKLNLCQRNSETEMEYVYGCKEYILSNVTFSKREYSTSASFLATELNQTIALLGPMHYYKTYHELYCISTPVRTSSNKYVFTMSKRMRGIDKTGYEKSIKLIERIAKIFEIYLAEKTTLPVQAVSLPPKTSLEYTFSDIIGENVYIRQLKTLGAELAQTNMPILLQGESGTGKEVTAQAIHSASNRSGAPFVPINCGAIPNELIESELFGYVDGAFTGAAKKGKMGKLEAASGGTLFLDEIDSMPLPVQSKLLRALSTQKISRLGSVEEIPIDIRIISATKVDLLQECDKGTFREDLFYRISVFPLYLPPLRERKDDIPLLVEYFVHTVFFSPNQPYMISDQFLDCLKCYDWRGNIRELRNVVEQAMFYARKDRLLTPEHLPPHILQATEYLQAKNTFEHEDTSKEVGLLELCEEKVISLVLEKTGGNYTRAAKILGITRQGLHKKLNKK